MSEKILREHPPMMIFTSHGSFAHGNYSGALSVRTKTKVGLYFGLNTHIHALLAEVTLKLQENRDVKIMVCVISETVLNH